MFIGVSGFSWSGSGAVIDYLMEFRENQVYTPEFLLAYHPDGLHDLDVNLNENCAKFLSSGVAIPRFRRIANSLLMEPTKGKAKQITEDYLDQLIQAKWIGLEQGQELLRNRWFYNKVGMRIRNQIITRLSPEFCWKYKPYPLAEMEYSMYPDNFLEKTQEYMNLIFSTIGLDINQNIVLNQPFPGNNPIPYMKYFANSRAIVVDRDPRDVFVFLKYVFPGHSYSVPLKDVNAYCEYFKHMHKNLNVNLASSDVLYLQFEDLIYQYSNTANKIRSFLGLGESSTPKKYFIPEESEANTQVFLKYGKSEEVKIIERQLSDYLYDFSKVVKRSKTDKVFDDNPKSSSYSFGK